MAAEGEVDDNFEPIIHYYQSLVKHLQWRDLGCVFAKGVAAVGDIQGNPALDQAKALGAALK